MKPFVPAARCVAWSVCAVLVASASATVVTAQGAPAAAGRDSSAVLRGRILNRADGSPLAGADVWVASADRHATTDSTGAYRLPGLRLGTQLLEVRHVGFATERDTVQLSGAHENVRTYALETQSGQLDTVHTVAQNGKYRSPRLQQFEERMQAKQGGYFIDDTTFRKVEGQSLPNVIAAHMPGIMVQNRSSTQVLTSTRKSCAGLALIKDPSDQTPDCHGNPRAADCYVAIYIDGVLNFNSQMGRAGGAPPDLAKLIPVSELAGAEFYADGASAPGGMHSNDDGCGSLYLWTRER